MESGLLNTIKSWLRHSFVFQIVDPSDFSVIRSFSLSNAKILFLLIIFAVAWILLGGAGSSLWFLDRDAETKNTLVRMSLTVDSLATELERRDKMLNTVRAIVTGDFKGLPGEDTTALPGGVKKEKVDLNYISEEEVKFRSSYQEDMKQLRNMGGFSGFKPGMFVTPVKGPVSTAFNPAEGHYGLDIAANKGTQIRTVASGRVVLAAPLPGGGNTLIVSHASGALSVYKHTDKMLKAAGDTVNAGDPIATVGNTGTHSSGPHLHFELWFDGRAYNPATCITF